jgi:hypothetical protein
MTVRNNLFSFIVILFYFPSQAQTFRYKANIDPVKKSGFYSVTVTPQLSSYVKPDFSDLRIINENNPVPYLLGSNLPMLKPDYFRPLKIINNTLTDSGKTMLIIENDPIVKIDGLTLRIKNAAISRTISLSGSDNLGDWYAIIENVNLEKRYVQDRDSYLENISFPLSSYRYLRIMVYNGKNDPLNIIAAGRLVKPDSSGALPPVLNPVMMYKRKDSSNHISYLTVFNPEAFHISYVRLQVRGPKFFKRNVEILTDQQQLGNFIISSDSAFLFQLPVFNDSSFRIMIYNEDNAPLDISSISTAQDAEKIITYLEPDKSYQLQMTCKSVTPPHYDLLNFRDSIPAFIPDLKFGKIEPIGTVDNPGDKSFFRKGWLWIAMAVVLSLLVLLTVRLTKEVGKSS